MKRLIDKATSLPLSAALLFLAGTGALAVAFVMQYGFGFDPCYLCLWQRFPYAIAAALSLLALAWRPYRGQTSLLLALCAAIYIGGAGLAFYHSGVEMHWWKGTDGCESQILQSASIDELREALLKAAEPRCDVIQGTLLGLSLTNWNVLAFLGLAFFAVLALRKHLQILPHAGLPKRQ